LKLGQPEPVAKNSLTQVSGQSDVISSQCTQLLSGVGQHTMAERSKSIPNADFSDIMAIMKRRHKVSKRT